MASARPASEGSGSQQETTVGQNRFVIPPAIDDCDDVPSPSQHRLSRASQLRQAGMSDDRDHDDGTHSEDDEEDVEASNSSGGEESMTKKRRKKKRRKKKTSMRRSKMIMRLKQRRHVRRRNTRRVTISLRCLCEICKLRLHICKRNLGRLQLMRCPFGTRTSGGGCGHRMLWRMKRLPALSILLYQIMVTNLTPSGILPNFELQGKKCNLSSDL